MATIQSTEPWMMVSGTNSWPVNRAPMTKPQKTPAVDATEIQWSTSWKVPTDTRNIASMKKSVKEMQPILEVITKDAFVECAKAQQETDNLAAAFSSFTFVSKDSKSQNPWAPQPSSVTTSKDKKTLSNEFSPQKKKPASPTFQPQQVPIAIFPPEEDDDATSPPLSQEAAAAAAATKLQIEEELSRQNLYKTELCRSFSETGSCRYGHKCQFAHGHHELRNIVRHPKYKTEICKTFSNSGSCPYGNRCRFIHPGAHSHSPGAFSNNFSSFGSANTSSSGSDEDEPSEDIVAGHSHVTVAENATSLFQSEVWSTLSRKSSVGSSATTTPASSPRIVPTQNERAPVPNEESESEEAKETARRLSFFQRLTVT